ncbi:MAG: hypothetical protein AYK19_19005 [Theionarchaea archaeon DG-70-1]|nr:MAG: hypothetical protein AYK19_19005 [Theionarchaea archaeon DG-70-1]
MRPMRNKTLIQEKMHTLIKMTAEFCDTCLDDEYRQLSEKLIRKMARKRDVPFLYGRIEIWAAAVVYALGTLNFLFDKRFEPYIAPDDICSYFQTNLSTTYQKSKKIRDMFKLKYGNEEFTTRYVIENKYQFYLVMREEFSTKIKNLVKTIQEKTIQENKKKIYHESKKSGNQEISSQENGKNHNHKLCEQLTLSDFIEADQ